ncbi:MAG TPA: beta-galactosidase [Bryobacteraceae bacterium]|jgi:hypothetical protein
MRFLAAVLLIGAAALPAAAPPDPHPEYVLAVEFPYYMYPRAQWERELVWMKTIGVRTVAFSIPWNWHQLQPGEFDFTGRTSPRRDLVGLVRILRKLELRGWVRPLPPVARWPNNGLPDGDTEGDARHAWLKELESLLATQTEKHGGPIAFVAGGTLAIDAPPPPQPIATVSATDPAALAHSRSSIGTARGSLLWTEVEDLIYPEGWDPEAAGLHRRGAVGLDGEERPATAALRRNAALLLNWSTLAGALRPVRMPQPPEGKLPAGIAAVELVSRRASAVSVTNRSKQPFRADLRVVDPSTRHIFIIPSVSVPAGESLWLPLHVSLGGGGLCRDCTSFGMPERIVYATAELEAVEFENGILAMEFAAPEPSEVILQLSREPVGPYLAAGRPTKFDWDDKTLRVRLPIPAGTGSAHHVRVGLAIEPPETSAFFSEARRLTIGRENTVSTVYSSPAVAERSRLRAPDGFTALADPKTPNEIDYTIRVPADALHGDWVNLALEADGVALGRAHVQLFRPASIRMRQAIGLHFGAQTRLAVEPPTAPVETRAGSEVEIVIRNNTPQIQNYHLEAAGDGLEFLPARADTSIGAQAERPVSFRIFGKEDATGLRDWRLRVSGGADLDLPMRVLLLSRSGAVAWSADLDGDGSPEWILESQKVRAVFSGHDGGRWLELTWKDTDTNFVPDEGVFAQPGDVDVRLTENGLAFVGNGWTRTVRLAGAELTIEQTPALPRDSLMPQTTDSVNLAIDRSSPSRAVYRLQQVTSREP